MSIGSYKKWTGSQRLSVLKDIKAKIGQGLIAPPSKCSKCGSSSGRIDYHVEDYDDPLANLEELCFKCHLAHHRAEKADSGG